jgi:hypothetical protein
LSVGWIVGLALVAVAVVDVAAAQFVVLPRVPEGKRGGLRLALFLGAAITFALGLLFLTGVIPLGGTD